MDITLNSLRESVKTMLKGEKYWKKKEEMEDLSSLEYHDDQILIIQNHNNLTYFISTYYVYKHFYICHVIAWEVFFR